MASSTANQMNLKTLQRVDSNIVEIIDNACQVALYKYERKSGKWEGTDIEGALFLFRRAVYPHYGFIIVNRQDPTNFMESLTSDMQIQLQEPYLLYQNHSGDIIGSWFYERQDLQRISKKIQSIILTKTTTPKRQRCASESDSLIQNVESNSQDIITLLTEAHKEYVKNVNKSSEYNSEVVNNLNTETEKKSLEKTIESAGTNKENGKEILKKYSSEENDPVSPRRRFMSTGSFDPVRAKQFSRMFSLMQLPSTDDPDENDNVTKKIEETVETNKLSNPIETSPPKQMPSFLNPFNISPPSSNSLLAPHFQTYSVDKQDDNLKTSSQNNQDWKAAINGDMASHLNSIKAAVKSHIEENPKVMLKIHEAYVSSLKSLFTNSSC